MGWFSNLTGSLGGGVSNLLGGVLAPVFGGANQLVSTATNSAGAVSLGGSQGMNFLQGIFGGMGFGGTPTAQPPSQSLQTAEQTKATEDKAKMKIIAIVGGVILAVIGIVLAIVKSKKK